jgi:F-type H+-transporting ATPase subunit a
MNIGDQLMKSLDIKTVFSITVAGHTIPVTETVVVSWAVMALLIAGALILTRNLQRIPKGAQTVLEAGIEFLNGFSKRQFGNRANIFGPYIGTIFLFLLVADILPAVTPVYALGIPPAFEIKPPAKDINLCAALATVTLALMLISGIIVRGPAGWCRNLLHPVPLMLPFNLMDYAIRPLSLCLRLFGNMLGGFIIMSLISIALAGAIKFSLVIPLPFSFYFDFFDGFVQALIFTFLTTLYISEAVNVEYE